MTYFVSNKGGDQFGFSPVVFSWVGFDFSQLLLDVDVLSQVDAEFWAFEVACLLHNVFISGDASVGNIFYGLSGDVCVCLISEPEV